MARRNSLERMLSLRRMAAVLDVAEFLRRTEGMAVTARLRAAGTPKGDESAIPEGRRKLAKAGLPHNDCGEVEPAAFAALLNAVTTGEPADFDPRSLGGRMKLANP